MRYYSSARPRHVPAWWRHACLTVLLAAVLALPAPSRAQSARARVVGASDVVVLDARDPAAGPVARRVSDSLTRAEALADLDLLRRALEDAHGGLYRFTRRQRLSRRFDAYRARLTGPVSRLAFIALVSRMVADVRDGHLRLDYEEAIGPAGEAAPMLPLRFSIEESRLVVAYNDTPADSVLRPGMEVLSINGRGARTVLDRILAVMPGDGRIQTGKTTRLGRAFGPYYWLFVDQSSSFDIVARTLNGGTVRTRLAGVTSAERAQAANPVNAPIRERLAQIESRREHLSPSVIASGIGYLPIRSFDGDDFAPRLARAFRTLQEGGATSLVIDLRGNGGGLDHHGALLVSFLVDRPYRYVDHIRLRTIRPSVLTLEPDDLELLRTGTVPDGAGGFLATASLNAVVSEQSPAPTPFAGKVVVLIDGGTFSTAADVSAILRSMGRATFVGTETGGTYEGNTSGLSAPLTLPNSRLRVRVHLFGYWTAVRPQQRGRGTLPDVTVERRLADVLRGADRPLDRAVELARDTSDRRR